MRKEEHKYDKKGRHIHLLAPKISQEFSEIGIVQKTEEQLLLGSV
jgi:hypothetical protein